MTTAIIGVGHIGSALAHHLVGGGEDVVLAATDTSRAEALALQLGPPARAASVTDAIARAGAIIFAVWLDQMKELIAQHDHGLGGKVIIDPSNPLRVVRVGENRTFERTLPDGQSAGSVVAALLPQTAHYVKAFGTLGAASLATAANRAPRRVVLFYATDDDVAATTAERLIVAAGFQPLKVGGVAAAVRIETPGGDLHQYAMNGELLDLDHARARLNAKEVLA